MAPPKSPLPRKFRARTRQSAFSLVEVVLAVGVISFAFVAILGLIPAGLSQFRQAMDNSVGAQIAQRIIIDCQQTDFTALTGGSTAAYIQPTVLGKGGTSQGTTRYFDEQGNEVLISGTSPTAQEMSGTGGTGGAPGEPGILYFVNTRIAPATTLPGTAGTSTNTGLASVVVQVVFNPSGKSLTQNLLQTADNNNLLVDPSKFPAGTIKTYCAMIGRN